MFCCVILPRSGRKHVCTVMLGYVYVTDAHAVRQFMPVVSSFWMIPIDLMNLCYKCFMQLVREYMYVRTIVIKLATCMYVRSWWTLCEQHCLVYYQKLLNVA